jgi:hypothetical protein
MVHPPLAPVSPAPPVTSDARPNPQNLELAQESPAIPHFSELFTREHHENSTPDSCIETFNPQPPLPKKAGDNLPASHSTGNGGPGDGSSPVSNAGTAFRNLVIWSMPLLVQTLLRAISGSALLIAFASGIIMASASDKTPSPVFEKDVQPILENYCYDCHADGAKKGKVTFDEFKTPDERLANRDLWARALKNVRAGIMPPEKKSHPKPEEINTLASWVKFQVFGIDPADPDPGRVTIRRLNRVEYHNTIKDLMGFDFKADEEFPPDDSGYGFDNIGDVLTVSPLLLEKYLQAAETIVKGAVPIVPRAVKEKTLDGKQFKGEEKMNGERLSFYKPAKISHSLKLDDDGDYKLLININVLGGFDFDPGHCKLTLNMDGQEVWSGEFGWGEGKKGKIEHDLKAKAGEHQFEFSLDPLVPIEQKKNSLDLKISTLTLRGPLDEPRWARSKNYDRFFTRENPPEKPAERRDYAREILTRFATKAFRRPVASTSVDRLLNIAEETGSEPGKRFEEGIARAFVATLASPRFIFRFEEPEHLSTASSRYPFVDEFALASRLSYFLWSTMPDDELFELARKGELRKNLASQVERMLKDSRSQELVENFTGQWLQTRDVEGISINSRAVLARDDGQEKEMERLRQDFLKRQQEAAKNPKERPKPDDEKEVAKRRQFFRPRVELDRDLRIAMQKETEMFVANIIREDRSVLEILNSDYTFLNERLAKHYGIPEVTGTEMRRVTLPKDSERGGVLTQGSILLVTSNPTRTSPVKRGLFVLDNFLGSPPPPPPADIPPLEDSEKGIKDKEPTLREVLQIHRDKPLCSSCHSRMDPLGFALENFNAMGMWRTKERGQEIDAAGKLITGESFTDVRELKKILVEKHRSDFYRCLTEKLLTYALGRGVEYYDTETVDQIVAELDKQNGKFSALLMGIVNSAPFQKTRPPLETREPLKASVQSGAPAGSPLTANK